MKRRVLEKLKITEISGVDRPCQEGARVAIMKRAPDSVSLLEARIKKLNTQVATLEKYSPEQPRDQQGRWSQVGSAAGRAVRAVGRVARATAGALWTGYKALPFEAQSVIAAGALGLGVQGVKAGIRTAQRMSGGPVIKPAVRTVPAISLKPAVSIKPAVDARNDSSSLFYEKPPHRFDVLGRMVGAGEKAISERLVGTTASVPFMITTSMKQELLDRGFTREKLKTMTPAQAHALLAKSRYIDSVALLTCALKRARPAGG